MPRRVSCSSLASYSYLAIGPVAQRLELTTHNRSVPGSNPGRPIQFYYVYSHTRLSWLLPHRHSDFTRMHCGLDVDLHVIGMQKSVTGGKGKSSQSSAWGMMDQIQLQTIGQITHYGCDYERAIPYTERSISISDDVYDNTSANFWSAMLLQNMINPDQLVSKTDRSWVEPAQLDYRARHFDPNFSADL